MTDPGTTKPSRSERLIAAGESMEKAGDSIAKAGSSFMACGCAVVVLVVIGFILWSVSCS